MCATQDGVTKWNDAKSAGGISTVGFLVGGLGAAGAAVLWFTAPGAKAAARPEVGLGLTGIQVRGVW